MTPETRDLLKRHYDYAKGSLKRLGALSAAERAACKAAGYPVDATATLVHADAVVRLLAAASKVRPEEVTGAFIAGVGGSWVRGRQPLISYAHARHMKPHAADPTPGYSHCRTCGFEGKAKVDSTEQVLRSHIGAIWNECHEKYVADLEDFARNPRQAPTKADRAVLREVLATAARAPADCTPGQLEKLLASAKVIPSTGKYERYGILEALADVGVLPNELIAPSWDRLVTQTERWDASKRVRSGPRSDIVLPFGAWRGSLGVDWKRAKELFDVTRPRA